MAYTGYANDLVDILEKNIKKYSQILKKTEQNIKEQSRINPNPIPEKLKSGMSSLAKLNDELRGRLDLLKTAPKFRLPFGANLFAVEEKDDVKSFSERMCAGMINLPYKQIVLEHEDKVGAIVGLYEDFGTHIEFTLNNSTTSYGEGISDEEMVYVLDKETGDIGVKDEFNLLSEKALMHFNRVGSSYGARPLLQLLAALSCSNVQIEDDLENVPSKTKQAMRRSRGKLPYFSYKVLTINTHIDANGKDIESTDEKGTHKRSHLRRGHIRTYKTGKRIWINAMAVGLKKNGTIEKSYNVK